MFFIKLRYKCLRKIAQINIKLWHLFKKKWLNGLKFERTPNSARKE